MDDPATEESDLPWEDDGDEQRNEEHRKDGIFADPGIIFPFSPGTNVKGQNWGERLYEWIYLARLWASMRIGNMTMQIAHQLTITKPVTSKRISGVSNAKKTSPLFPRT